MGRDSPSGEGSDSMADARLRRWPEAVRTRKRDGREPKPKAMPHPTAGGAGGEGQGGASDGAAVRAWRVGAGALTGAIRSSCSRSRRLRGCRSWCRSATGGCSVSPFTFFRGAAYPMAADLAGEPRTGLNVQLCGDAHLSNFGAFAASDRRLVFSINDFDETLPGPFEWDVKRLVASFAVAGRDRGFDAKQRRSINRAVARAYREAIRAFARDAQPRPLVLPHRRRRDRRVAAQHGQPQAAEAVRAQRGEGAVEGQHEGVREAHDDRRRRAQDRERPAAHRPDRGGRVRASSQARSRSSSAARSAPTGGP